MQDWVLQSNQAKVGQVDHPVVQCSEMGQKLSLPFLSASPELLILVRRS